MLIESRHLSGLIILPRNGNQTQYDCPRALYILDRPWDCAWLEVIRIHWYLHKVRWKSKLPKSVLYKSIVYPRRIKNKEFQFSTKLLGYQINLDNSQAHKRKILRPRESSQNTETSAKKHVRKADNTFGTREWESVTS